MKILCLIKNFVYLFASVNLTLSLVGCSDGFQVDKPSVQFSSTLSPNALPASSSTLTSCLLNGQAISNGQSVTVYSSATAPYGQPCAALSRTCKNGVLSGSGSSTSCAPDPGATCKFNGQTIANGASVDAFAAESVPFGETCSGVSRKCNNGILSGSGDYVVYT